MKRIQHILKKAISTVTPTNMLFFDTETKDKHKGKHNAEQRHTLWFGCFRAYRLEGTKRTREREGSFDTVQAFWETVYSRLDTKRTLNLYCHNAAFDLTIVDFWRISQELSWSIDFAVLESPPVIISVTTPEGRFNVIDTLNYFKTSLKALGKSVGLEKIDIDIEKATIEDALPYCQRDTEIIDYAVYSLIKFVRENQLGKLGSTVASLAYSAFRHRFMSHQIHIHDRERVLKLEQASYHGGMVNCLQVGKVAKTMVYKLDVNSLYPTMMQYQYPIKLEYCLDRVSPEFCLAEMRKRACIAEVSIETYDNTYPVMVDKELVFAHGKYVTTLAGPELAHAIAAGVVKKVWYAAFYQQAPIFLEYVRYFWNLRAKYKAAGDEANSVFTKYMLNSLYGKFAQGAYKWSTFNPATLYETLSSMGEEITEDYLRMSNLPELAIGQMEWLPNGVKTPIKLRTIGATTQIQQRSGWHYSSFIGISSYVTSYARRYLMELLSIAGLSNCYYYDTDSVFTNLVGYNRLKRAGKCSETELGGLKLEGKEYEPTFLAPKDYLFGENYTLKGIRNPGNKAGKKAYRQLQFEGLPSVIKRGGEPYILIKTVSKNVSHKYKKGMVKPNGRTEPFRLGVS